MSKSRLSEQIYENMKNDFESLGIELSDSNCMDYLVTLRYCLNRQPNRTLDVRRALSAVNVLIKELEDA